MRYQSQEEPSTWWREVFRSISFSMFRKGSCKICHFLKTSATLYGSLPSYATYFDHKIASSITKAHFYFIKRKRVCVACVYSVHLLDISRISNEKLWSIPHLDQEARVKLHSESLLLKASSMPSYENTCILKTSEMFIVHKSICLMDITQRNIHNEHFKGL